MRTTLISSAVALAGCGNSLPPAGSCDVAASGDTPTVDSVALPNASSAFYDDLSFAPLLGKIVAAPEGAGRAYLVDPATMAAVAIDVSRGVGSADASATTIYAADRGADSILGYEIASGAMVAMHALSGSPDYVRVAPTTGEVWVTIPGRNRLEILDGATLQAAGSVTLPAPPEGLTFDDAGRAYANANGSVVAVDVARRVVVGEWNTGCGISHGFPQIDLAYGLAFGGCRANGGVGVATIDGELRAGYEAGGGSAVLAYDHVRHHLYVHGDPSGTLSILAVCSDGELAELARAPLPNVGGHAAVTDGGGRVWIANPDTGGLTRITDPFAN